MIAVMRTEEFERKLLMTGFSQMLEKMRSKLVMRVNSVIAREYKPQLTMSNQAVQVVIPLLMKGLHP